MANIPTPRSWNSLVGDMVAAFLSRYGLKKLKPGSPVLSTIEAVAQSQLRSSQDTFDLLNASSLDNATGTALDRKGAAAKRPRGQQSASSGKVNVTDTSFTKISTKLYQGLPAPIIGSTTIYLADASEFPTSGNIYLGRNTSNYEGPIAYTAAVNSGTYWTLTLNTGTRRFHNVGESVILAQGGNRTIAAGTVVQTPQGNTSDAIKFTTLFTALIPDGETQVTDVQVVAQDAGVGTNVPAGAISQFGSSPFAGAAITNPLPFTNGQDSEDDDTYREEIRNANASRSKGTSLAITTAVKGIVATDENKRLISSQVVTRQGYPTTLYIDDGTGYEESSSGVALETLMDSATGGEQYFQVSATPVTKAQLITTSSAPFTLSDGAVLVVTVGGILYSHTFSVNEFRAITNASAYEVVASINADSTIGFGAATCNGGTQVRIFAKADSEEDIQVGAPSQGIDANLALGFASGRVDTMALYRNDRLLTKDGQKATVLSQATSLWTGLTSGVTLTLAVDKTPAVTYTFVDQDFIDANTGYTTVGVNSPAAWALVLEAKIPGITAKEANGLLEVTSNAGPSSRAQLAISGGTMVSPGQVFVVQTVTGKDNDYTLDRNTGEIRLETPLSAGDSLTAGSTSIRAFLNSPSFSTSILSSTGNLWMAVDGAAQLVTTGLNSTASLTTTVATVEAWGGRIRVTAGSSVFANVQTGDWVIIWDSAINAAMRGTFRVAQATATWFELERNTTVGMAQGAFSLATNGMVFVRTQSQLQDLSLSSGTYTATSLASAINSQIAGAGSSTYRTTSYRVNTNTYGSNGDIALVAADTQGLLAKLTPGAAVVNSDNKQASVESGNSQIGTPEFTLPAVAPGADTSHLVLTTSSNDVRSQDFVVGLKAYQEAYNNASNVYSYGHNKGRTEGIQVLTASSPYTATLRTPTLEQIAIDRVYLASPPSISPVDDLVVVVDQDTTSKRFTVPLHRKLTPVGTTYGSTNTFRDADNGGVSLAQAFGLTYSFNDFAVYMPSRVITDSSDNTKSILWRYARPGPDGDVARLKYVYPTAASQALSVVTNPATSKHTDISVVLPSGALKTGYSVRSTTKIGTTSAAGPSGLTILSFILGYSISSATRDGANNTTLTLTLPTIAGGALMDITNHGFQVGDSIWVNSTNVNFTSGLKTLTAVTSTTITYTEVAAAQGATANIGTVSNDPTGLTTFAGAGVPVAAGDILTVTSASTLPASYDVTMRVTYYSDQALMGYVESTATHSGTPTWTTLGSTSGLTIYPLVSTTASTLASTVAGLAAAKNSTCSVTAKVMGTGAGVISLSSYDQALAANTWNNLSDGLNFVQTTTAPLILANDYQLTFKNAIAAGLATASDWANETVYLVPITTANLVSWLSTLTVTGLSSVASIQASSQAQKLQIASLTSGSAGAVQVQGGASNSGSATVSGSAILVTDPDTTTYSVATVRASDAQNFFAGMWTQVQNEFSLPKAVIQPNTTLTGFAANGVITIDSSTSTPFWTYSNSGPILSHTWQIEKQGKYICFSYDTSKGSIPSLVGVKEGDWVYIAPAATPTAHAVAVSSPNQGVFRVIRVEDGTVANSNARAFWIENASALEETSESDISFFTFDSVMPGDVLTVNTSQWGAGNQGSWTVVTVGQVAGTGSQFVNSSSGKNTIKVSVTTKAPQVISSSVGALGSTNYRLVQVTEAQPTKLIKRIQAISPNQADGTYVDIKFTSSPGYGLIGASAGSVISPLDKLAFSTELAVGVDGYSHTTGLIAEANRVVYGDPQDPATYPGIAAAGAVLNISGPMVKRITCALSVRIRSGTPDAIANRVRSAVAAVINSAGVGESIAISSILTAAAAVNGVASVAMISPTFTSGSDLIPVQPYEKPMVLNLATDIQVSFVGQ